jgi:hypothetical protein
MKMKDICELAAKYLREVKKMKITGEQLFNSSPTGELAHIFYIYNDAAKHYGKQQLKLWP